MLQRVSVAYPINSPKTGYREQDPEVIFQAVLSSLQQLVQNMGYAPEMICLSAAMHSLIAMDKEGNPLTAAIIWADSRSAGIAGPLKQTALGKELYERCGTPIHAMSPLCKIAWLREQAPEIFQHTHLFISIKTYVLHRLFGEWVEDHGLGSATGMMDIASCEWYESALAYAGIEAEQLPRLVPVDHILTGLSKKWAQALPISSDTPFLIGGSDGCLANLGALAQSEAEAVMSIGTSGAIRIQSSQLKIDETQSTFCYVLEKGEFIRGGATNNGAVAYQWFVEQFHSELNTAEQYALAEKTRAIKPGADGLLFMPYLLGERAPLWNVQASGAWIGLSKEHTALHSLKALMEGVLFNLRWIAEALEQKEQTIQKIQVTGGFTMLPTWVQMAADIFGVPVAVSAQQEQAAFGAVLLGLRKRGVIKNWDEAERMRKMEQVFKPSLAKHAIYEQYYPIFKNLYPKLKEEMEALARMRE